MSGTTCNTIDAVWSSRTMRRRIYPITRPETNIPLSLLLDVFQSIQKKGIRFMLVLVGLPTLFPKLVEARTFAERMFRVVFLDRLAKHSFSESPGFNQLGKQSGKSDQEPT